MIKYVFSDVGGVLGAPAVSLTYDHLKKTHSSLDKERFRALMLDERTLTGSFGTLDNLLQTDYKDLGIKSIEIITFFKQIPKFEDVWKIYKEIDKKGVPVGIISDQFAESADHLRTYGGFTLIFHPILFSPEVKLCKKDRRIFDLARERIELQAEELIMVDDHQFVLDSAKGAGWNTTLYQNPEQLREELAKYGVL